MLAASKTKAWPEANQPDAGDVKLTASEANRLLAICVELVDLCSKVTARVDPAVGAMVAYAREEALSGASVERMDA